MQKAGQTGSINRTITLFNRICMLVAPTSWLNELPAAEIEHQVMAKLNVLVVVRAGRSAQY